MKYCLILSIAVLKLVASVPLEDLVDIKEIPQLPQNYTHRWYSGYLSTSDPGTSIYYVFFESQNNMMTDPVMLWLQGGPGCSSLFGLFYENGPLRFHASSIESFINEKAWNKNASMLYIESPGGVGFSTTSSQEANDASTAKTSLEALVDFFNVKFPELQKNDFYISGESYGGIYIPDLAMAILRNNVQTSQQINLKGFIIGNGCTLGEECTDGTWQPYGYSPFQFKQFNDHAFISPDNWRRYEERCTQNVPIDISSRACRKSQKEILTHISYDYVDLDNLNGKCYHVPPQYEEYAVQKSYKQSRRRHMSHLSHGNRQNDGLCDYELGDFYLLNNDTARKALHINVTTSELIWQTCTNDSIFTYQSRSEGSYALYHPLIALGLRIWIYSGDVDANVPITGTLTWITRLKEEMHLKTVEEWRPWYVHGNQEGELQVGGMVWQLEGITFVSVRDGGHEVPFWQPERAHVMVQHFLSNTPLPINPHPSLIQEYNIEKHFKKRSGG